MPVQDVTAATNTLPMVPSAYNETNVSGNQNTSQRDMYNIAQGGELHVHYHHHPGSNQDVPGKV